MDLTTTYLGMKLPHPMMAGASPLSDELDTIKQLEDAGSAAIVLRSRFEEQIVREQMADMLYQGASDDSFAAATTYFPAGGQARRMFPTTPFRGSVPASPRGTPIHIE